MSGGERPITPRGWRAAFDRLTPEMLAPGSVIAAAWLEDAFVLPDRPSKDTHLAMPEIEKILARRRLTYVTEVSALREALLVQRKVMLVPVPGLGYKVVPPADQVDTSSRMRMAEVHKAVGKMYDEIQHTDVARLSDDGRRRQANALSKTAALQALLQPRKRLEGFVPDTRKEGR